MWEKKVTTAVESRVRNNVLFMIALESVRLKTEISESEVTCGWHLQVPNIFRYQLIKRAKKLLVKAKQIMARKWIIEGPSKRMKDWSFGNCLQWLKNNRHTHFLKVVVNCKQCPFRVFREILSSKHKDVLNNMQESIISFSTRYFSSSSSAFWTIKSHWCR